ncbi:formate dehydrogenase accessory sulfurtransferase FdhD [Flavobacteriaceae bacterium]|jgi:FdhD protein|nr:formate dehydrogenase accessory sulfurtransferase FdhD [Flavobacteriaceae bacterium]MDB4404638.1 formate dehydrogenase accessory sulfurtransferase FdhD [bacterium]
MATRHYEGKKFNKNNIDKVVDALTIEEALQININDKPFTVSMRTPGNDMALVRGLLHAEGIIKNTSFKSEILIKEENSHGIVTVVNVNIPKSELGEGYSNSRSLLSVSSCGICGKTALSDLAFIGKMIDDKDKIDITHIHDLFNKMNMFQFDFKESGGTHAAAAFTIDGELVAAMEDIGRHNAVDKIIGHSIQSNRLKQVKIMTVSGRISYEIIIKCFKAQIPFLAAVSAPSSLAVDYAKELGITLFAFCRNQRATCYANPYRVRIQSNQTKAS